jgi:hypothetical protein
MIPCVFDGHHGYLQPDTGMCMFYYMTFDSILEVAKYLKNVTPGPEYEGEYVSGKKVMRDPEMDMWWSEGRWWCDKKTAVKAAKRMFR